MRYAVPRTVSSWPGVGKSAALRRTAVKLCSNVEDVHSGISVMAKADAVAPVRTTKTFDRQPLVILEKPLVDGRRDLCYFRIRPCHEFDESLVKGPVAVDKAAAELEHPIHGSLSRLVVADSGSVDGLIDMVELSLGRGRPFRYLAPQRSSD